MDTTLSKVLEIFGSQTNVAKALGLTPQAVQLWEKIPTKHALKLERISEGKVTALEILESRDS